MLKSRLLFKYFYRILWFSLSNSLQKLNPYLVNYFFIFCIFIFCIFYFLYFKMYPYLYYMIFCICMCMYMIGRTLRDAIYGDIRQVERVVSSDMFGTHFRRTGRVEYTSTIIIQPQYMIPY
jgi:hypothetical protein